MTETEGKVDDSTNEKKANDGSENNEETENSRVFEYFSEKIEDQKPKIVEELLILYETTKIDNELAEIEEEKGDLPESIENLRSKTEQMGSDLDNLDKRLEENVIGVAELSKTNKSFEEKISKYDEKKYIAKSNKEYDDITKAIDAAFGEVEKNEKKIKELLKEREKLQANIDETGKKLEELRSDLEEKENILSELNQEFEDEEKELLVKRKEHLSRLPDEHRRLYEKINRAYNGEATAIVRKDNCTGCYNSLPPQKVIEIKMAEKIYTCHSCGRILISEELLQDQN